MDGCRIAGAKSAEAERAIEIAAPDILDARPAPRAQLLAGFEAWLDQLDAPVRLTVASRQGAGRRRRSVWLRSASSQLAVQVSAQLERLCGAEVRGPGAFPPLVEGPLGERVTGIAWAGRWVECLRLTTLPRVPVEAGWLWQLVGEAQDLDLTVSISPVRAVSADRRLRHRLRELAARELGEDWGMPDPALVVERAAATRLREVLARGEGRAFEVAVSMAVGGGPVAEVRSATARLRRRALGMRAQLAPAWLDEGPALLEAAGWGRPRRAFVRLLTTPELATFWPWLDGPGELEPGSCRIGRHLRTQGPVGLKLAAAAAAPNSNCCVIAASGAGKSYLARVVGVSQARSGTLTVVVDPENEHREWCEAVGGTYLDLARGGGFGFNVFESATPGEGELAARELVELLAGPLSPPEAGAFLEACEAARRGTGGSAPVLAELLPAMAGDPHGRSLAARLRPWVEGQGGMLFSRPGRGPEVTRALAVGLRDLPERWRAGAALLVSQWLWAWAQRDPAPKQVIIDEAGLLAARPQLAELMGQMARRLRKYSGSLLLLTQAPRDLAIEGFGELVAGNSATLLVGSTTGPGVERLKAGFHLTDEDCEWLQRCRRGEFLMLAGATQARVRVEASETGTPGDRG
ncbi:MAG: VirB4 family type IV secretion system protein [Candidatus Dormibacteria bacterium]